jgi:hypothetical protein
MLQYRYVLFCAEDFQSIDLATQRSWPQEEDEGTFALQDRLAEGWQPVREMSLPRVTTEEWTFVLILLQKET